jgi:para-nitrobenzyl esterase
MVWVHGGGYEIGTTVDACYDFSNFVRENPSVIVVSVAYRLGVLGFLHLAHLEDGADYADAQNLGLLDLKMALRWVHENVAAFGGDPDNVTIFGESAGAGAVSLLPLVEGAQAYFRRVIAESGSPALSRSSEQAIACTDELLEELGCRTVADLMGLDAQELVRAAGEVLSMRQFPVRDGRVLPRDTLDAYAQGATKDIDLIIGCNKDEMNCYVSSMGVDAYLAWGDEIKRRKYAQLTDGERTLAEGFGQDVGGDGYSHVSRLIDQIWFIAPFFRTAENHVGAGGRAYAYFFTTESSVPLMKSGHGIELYCVLDHPEMTESTGRPFDQAFCKTMRQMWVAFATCGDPSLPAEASPDGRTLTWPVYDLEERHVMVFDEFDTRAVRESEKGIVDWARAYPLTKYYVF